MTTSTEKADPDPIAAANISAISTKQAAKIAAYAGILAALLSVFSGVTSGILTARTTANVTERQLSAETEKSRAEFTRTQRQATYADTYADSNELRFTEWRLQRIVAKPNPSVADYMEQAKIAEDQIAKLVRDFGNVQVIGGQGCIDAVKGVEEVHRKRIDWIVYGRDLLTRDSYSAKEKKDLMAGVYGDDERLLTFLGNFVVAARQDLAQ